MKYSLLLWLICSLDFSNCAFRMTPLIEISQGKILGLETQRGDYRKYLGIPYATFMGRFQEPGPMPQWSTTLNATANKVYCAQYSSRMRIPIGDEDCFTLNVFTPGQHSHKKLLPVMVYIHGGGFMDGSANDLFLNPEPLVKKGVIVVVINYRLGAFGFLCLRIKGAPGNAGLKDQVAALKWVNQNIRAFGGDPQLVTVFGQNAGAASVGHLMLSREAKGLFHRAIMESGSALSPLAFAYNPIERAAVVGSNLGYNTKNPYELLNVFNNVTKAQITMASVVDNPLNPLSQYIFRPCAEKLIPGIKPFMTQSPKQTLVSGNYNKVPVVIGYNDKDGMEYAARFDYSLFERLLDNLEEILPDNLILSSDAKAKAAKIVKQFYFEDREPSKGFPQDLIDYFSDITTDYSSEIFAEYLVESSQYPVFTYYFQYDSRRSAVKPTIRDNIFINGAANSDELLYLFQPIVAWTLSMNKTDAIMVDRMTMMWTNFARLGDPTFIRSSVVPVRWLPSDNESMQYLFIDEDLRMNGKPNPRRFELWRYLHLWGRDLAF